MLLSSDTVIGLCRIGLVLFDPVEQSKIVIRELGRYAVIRIHENVYFLLTNIYLGQREKKRDTRGVSLLAVQLRRFGAFDSQPSGRKDVCGKPIEGTCRLVSVLWGARMILAAPGEAAAVPP